MKKILSLILCLILSCSLVGCNTVSEYNELAFEAIGGRTFMRLPTESHDYILVDLDTKVQYFAVYIFDNRAGMEVLVDPEGKPLLYEGEIPYERAE